jgi:ligand-binding sensor domain-containing protein
MKQQLVPRFSLLGMIMLVALLAAPSYAVLYEEGDWVDYNNFRYISSIAADQQTVYFGTTGGVIRYNRNTRSWLDPLTAIDGLPSNNIRSLVFDPDTYELWINTDRGSGRYNTTFESWYTDSDFPGDQVVNDWNAARFKTLFMPFEYDYSDGYVSDPNMRRYPITVGFQDDLEDIMYIGTWGLGAAVINTRYFDYKPLNFGPYSRDISRVVEIDRTLWLGTTFGTDESAVTSYNLDSKAWTYYQPPLVYGLDNTEITSGTNSGNYIWLGTTDGLLRIENDQRFRTYRGLPHMSSTDILSVVEYGGYLYLGTDNGIAIIPPTGELPDSLFKSPLPDSLLMRGQQVFDLLVVKDVLYIATENSVYSFNSPAGQFRQLDTPANDLSWGATAIYSDGGNLYFAARSGIVTIDIATDSSSVVHDPIFADGWIVHELYADKQFIWAATDRGLWKYRKSDSYTYLYGTADGLPVNRVNSIVADGDYFWLGTSRGLVRFLWNSPGRGD